ncbi:hypothetical protein V2J09_018819 [Rumex salicifolius]
MDPRLAGAYHAQESPIETASSHEISPNANTIVVKKQYSTDLENDNFEQLVVRRIFTALRNIAEERVDIISEKMQVHPDDYLEELKNGLRVVLEGTGGSQHREIICKMAPNTACHNPLPADDCTCEICSKNGFCNICMCVICKKFDFEVNTCRWIGCDSCSHLDSRGLCNP